jgi:hypothetical protein
LIENNTKYRGYRTEYRKKTPDLSKDSDSKNNRNILQHNLSDFKNRPSEEDLKNLQVKAELCKLGAPPRAYVEKLAPSENEAMEIES